MDVVYAVAGLVVDLIASVVLGVVVGVVLGVVVHEFRFMTMDCPSWTSF